MEVFAEGVRNSVGFDWHPVTHELWFTDNGRDMLGDDVPNDELNVAYKAGLHFGFPFCHQGDVAGPGVRRTARVLDDRAARAEARRARGGDWLHVLHRQHVSGQLQERGDHRPAWVVEPIDAERLSRHGGAHRRTSGDGLRTARGRLPAWCRHPALGGRGAMGVSQRPSGRRAATAGRIDPDQRRHRQSSDPCQLQRQVANEPSVAFSSQSSPSPSLVAARSSAGPHRGDDQRHRRPSREPDVESGWHASTSAARRKARSTAPRRAPRRPNPGFRHRPPASPTCSACSRTTRPTRCGSARTTRAAAAARPSSDRPPCDPST